MKSLLLLLLVTVATLFAATESATSSSEANTTVLTPQEIKRLEAARHQAEVEAKNEQIRRLKIDLKRSNRELGRESIWLNSYSSYLKYVDVKKEHNAIQKEIEELSKYGKSSKDKDKLDYLIHKESILNDQLTLLKDHSESPFSMLLKPDEIGSVPEITNPIDIFAGISFTKRLNNSYADYIARGNELRLLVIALREKKKTLNELAKLDENATQYKDKITFVSRKLTQFENGLDTLNTTAEVYLKRIQEVQLQVEKGIKEQVVKLFNLSMTIMVLFVIFLVLKFIIKKYITDNERFYMANKIITFINITLIIFIIFFTYIDKVAYLVTVLGFASAGIAIATGHNEETCVRRQSTTCS